MLPSSEKFKKDLQAFHRSWEEISHKDSLLENPQFLMRMALEIQNVHDDIQKGLVSKENEKDAQLLDYMMKTPWGAPFVFETPLLDAALCFQSGSFTDLHDLIKEFLHYKDEINHRFFDYVHEIEKTLKNHEK